MGRWQDAAAKKAAQIHAAGGMLTDQQAYLVPAIFMSWDETAIYATGDRVRFDGLLYRCLQAHTAQADWTPAAAVSLWVRIDDPAIEWPEWRQPLGAQDSYAKGAKVTYKGARYKSLIDGNVWSPDAYPAGWEVQA